MWPWLYSSCVLLLYRMGFMMLDLTQSSVVISLLNKLARWCCQVGDFPGAIFFTCLCHKGSASLHAPSSLAMWFHTQKYLVYLALTHVQKKLTHLEPLFSQQQPNTMLPSPLSNNQQTDPHHRIPCENMTPPCKSSHGLHLTCKIYIKKMSYTVGCSSVTCSSLKHNCLISS